MKTLIISALCVLLMSCGPKKKGVCECLSLASMLTDSLLLSKQELREKTDGCAWIYEELSPTEQANKFVECNGSSK